MNFRRNHIKQQGLEGTLYWLHSWTCCTYNRIPQYLTLMELGRGRNTRKLDIQRSKKILCTTSIFVKKHSYKTNTATKYVLREL